MKISAPLLIFLSSFLANFANAQDYTATVKELGKPDSPVIVKKEFNKPPLLTGPPNYEEIILANFEKLKKEKSIVVDFLVWDRLDTYRFKVSYLGEQDLRGEKTQAFKMNIDNFLVATFVSPIKVWFSSDMSQLRMFSGRVGVKRLIDGKFRDFDADVIYQYKT